MDALSQFSLETYSETEIDHSSLERRSNEQHLWEGVNEGCRIRQKKLGFKTVATEAKADSLGVLRLALKNCSKLGQRGQAFITFYCDATNKGELAPRKGI